MGSMEQEVGCETWDMRHGTDTLIRKSADTTIGMSRGDGRYKTFALRLQESPPFPSVVLILKLNKHPVYTHRFLVSM